MTRGTQYNRQWWAHSCPSKAELVTPELRFATVKTKVLLIIGSKKALAYINKSGTMLKRLLSAKFNNMQQEIQLHLEQHITASHHDSENQFCYYPFFLRIWHKESSRSFQAGDMLINTHRSFLHFSSYKVRTYSL